MDAHRAWQDRHPATHRRPTARYQPWFDNARRLKDLIAKLEAASLAAAAQTEGWAPTNANTPTTRSHPDRQGR
jgi:hypothetical protein